MTTSDREIELKLRDAIAGVLKGTEWVPEDGLVTDYLLVTICVDAESNHGISWASFGSVAAAEGMAHHVLRCINVGFFQGGPMPPPS